MKKKYLLCLLSLLMMASLLLAGCGKKEEADDLSECLTGTYYVALEVADYGTIMLKLDADAAPRTVTNFVSLVNNSFYDGLTFHRVINGFMIQGGDPNGNGTGGSDSSIRGEFSSNGIENEISHIRGTVSMARSNDPDSASSQFFIVQQDAPHLDGNYAAFGQVVAGMSVVDAICASVSVEDDNGTVKKENQPVITSAYLTTEDAADYAAQQEKQAPASTATVSLQLVNTYEDLAVAAEWLLAEEGECFLLSADEDLLSVSLRSVDISESLDYDAGTELASHTYLAAGELIALRLVVPEGLPDTMLVIEDHNGGRSTYLIGYDGLNGGAYLVPILGGSSN